VHWTTTDVDSETRRQRYVARLPNTDWKPTLTALHMWMQIIGKVELTLTPFLTEWWTGFVPADCAVMLRWLTGTIISGNGSQPTDDSEKVTGRLPITFQDFARRNAPAWTQAQPRMSATTCGLSLRTLAGRSALRRGQALRLGP
jgi:hypothetical protein